MPSYIPRCAGCPLPAPPGPGYPAPGIPGMADMSTGLICMLACACAATGLMTMPGGRPCTPLGCGAAAFGAGPYMDAGYGMSCAPYGEGMGRIIPGGGMGTHIGWGGYCGEPALGSIGRGMGLGVIACAYIMFGLGELIIGDGYPAYAGRMPTGIIGGCDCASMFGWRSAGGDVGLDMGRVSPLPELPEEVGTCWKDRVTSDRDILDGCLTGTGTVAVSSSLLSLTGKGAVKSSAILPRELIEGLSD